MTKNVLLCGVGGQGTVLASRLIAHLIRGGADIHAVQAMLGHSDSTTTHMYAAYSGNTVGETYRAALPRK